MRDPYTSSRWKKFVGLLRNFTRAAVVLCLFGFFCSPAAKPAGQQAIPNPQQPFPNSQQAVPNPMNRQSRSPFDDLGGNDPFLVARQMRALNAERQKSLISDTNKLLKLAQELNSEIETGNPNMLTQVQLRKVADIEKLARNVRQKMSISYVGEPQFQEPVPQQPR